MSIKSFFSKLFSIFKKAGSVLVQVEDLLPDALFVVNSIALATPTKSDDEIVRVAGEYGLGPVQITDFGRKEDLLRAIARTALQRRVRMSIKESVLNAAIELAVLEHKGK